MCYQVVELYSTCGCLHHQHAIDRCPRYGARGHGITQRTILLGYPCPDHLDLLSQPSQEVGEPVYLDEGYARRSRGGVPRRYREFAPPVQTTQVRPETMPKKLDSNHKPNEEIPNSIHSQPIADRKALPDVPIKVPRGSEVHTKLDSGKNHATGSTTAFPPGLSEESMTALGARAIAQMMLAWPSTDTRWLDPSLTEDIYRRLLLFQDLRYLWPQLAVQCGSNTECVNTIGDFLGRYCEDLKTLAGSAEYLHDNKRLCFQAAHKVVEASQLNIARRIFAAQQDAMDDCGLANERITRFEATTTKHPLLVTCERFLYGSEPVMSLQSRVTALVTQMSQRPATDGIGLRLYEMAENYFSNVVSVIYRPLLKPGSYRLKWKCVCGRAIYDDYTEIQLGGIVRLEERLKQYRFIDGVSQAASDSTIKPDPSHRSSFISAAVNFCCKPWNSDKRVTGLPRHTALELSAGELGVCSVTPGTIQGHHNFMLLCVPFMRWAAKLWQAEVCKINSDREFFRLLRYYYNQHGKRPWSRLRKIEGVHFVKFEMYPSQLVDVQNCPDVPNESQAFDTYIFDPLPAETNPPIGPKLLAHLLEHPEHAEVLPVLYRKFPKKLRAKLQACPQKGSAAGWGIEFVEGLNWFVIFLCGCMGFSAALVSAIVWSVVRNDVQGGFAIAGFMLAFLGFCLGIARLEILTV